MTQKSVDLAGIFQEVTQSLAANQQSLNNADTINQDHGSNMVSTFQTITGALQKKQGSSDSAALSYAAKALSKKATSGSGQLYAQNLTQAAAQFKGKKVDSQGALQLLQTLIGSSQSSQSTASQASGGADMLGTLLGGLTGAETPAAAPQSQGSGDLLGALLGGLAGESGTAQEAPASGGGDMLGTLLSGFLGSETAGSKPQQNSSFDMQDLLAAGMAYMQAKQKGQGNLEALVQAFVAGSGMGNTQHRNQSTQIVVQSFLQALNAMGNKS